MSSLAPTLGQAAVLVAALAVAEPLKVALGVAGQATLLAAAEAAPALQEAELALQAAHPPRSRAGAEPSPAVGPAATPRRRATAPLPVVHEPLSPHDPLKH